MYFKARAGVFDETALGDLRGCANHLMAASGTDRTSLGHHIASAEARGFILPALRRFFASPLPDLFESRFGKPPALTLGFVTIRRQAPGAPQTRVGWHLDLNFVYDQSPFLVAWVPLEDVGRTRIGLEVCVPKRQTPVSDIVAPWVRRAAAGGSMVFTDDEVADTFGADGYDVRPLRMQAGDAAVFDQFVLHRTQQLAQATDVRHSFEFRMVDLNSLPLLALKSDGLYCRRNRSVPCGIEFMTKQADQPLRTVDEMDLDALRTSVSGDARSSTQPASTTC